MTTERRSKERRTHVAAQSQGEYEHKRVFGLTSDWRINRRSDRDRRQASGAARNVAPGVVYAPTVGGGSWPAAPVPAATGEARALRVRTAWRTFLSVGMFHVDEHIAAKREVDEAIEDLLASAPTPGQPAGSVSEDFHTSFYARSDHKYSGIQIYDWLLKWEAEHKATPGQQVTAATVEEAREWLYPQLTRFADGCLRNRFADTLARAYQVYPYSSHTRSLAAFVEQSPVVLTFVEIVELLVEFANRHPLVPGAKEE